MKSGADKVAGALRLEILAESGREFDADYLSIKARTWFKAHPASRLTLIFSATKFVDGSTNNLGLTLPISWCEDTRKWAEDSGFYLSKFDRTNDVLKFNISLYEWENV